MRNIRIATLLILALIMMAGCKKKSESVEKKEEKKQQVGVEEVSSEAVDQLYEYTAVVDPEATNNIAPTIAGRIQKIYVEVGDRVSKGQKLVSMDATNLDQQKTQLDNLETTFKRIDELYKAGGISKSDWDAQKTALEVARTAYNNLMTNTTLTSPLNGIVTMRNYDSGDIYAGNPILQIQQITPVKILINVSEAQYNLVKEGMKADITIDVFEGETFTGKVTLKYPTIDTRTHTFPVEITLANANGKVRPGMYAHVTMNYGTFDHVVVPDNCIIKQQGSGDRYVYVYKDGKVYYKKVVLGRRMGNRYELISGVESGDLVVTTGYTKLNDGMEVELIQK
ncbi:MAG: efflux RND transporter periplasmic adaptor subunit [Bacteroidales bacterium]|nr:efflux RND transporter periplasmic adaptor subunit [Bacteroidales bacterium]